MQVIAVEDEMEFTPERLALVLRETPRSVRDERAWSALLAMLGSDKFASFGPEKLAKAAYGITDSMLLCGSFHDVFLRQQQPTGAT